jgi:cytidylate kinase
MMDNPEIIAIDGPAGSGKSTIGKLLAEAAISQGINVEDEQLVSQLAEEIDIDLRIPSKNDGRDCDVLIEDQDVTWDIRKPEVDANVSIVSTYPTVRQVLSEKQRQIGLQGKVVMLGRDIGTVVLPEADLKVYLDASIEERASRRYKEMIQRGEAVEYDSILTMLRDRDRIDSTREIAPLKTADDAIVINTDGLNIEEVYVKFLELIEKPHVK